MHIAYSVWYTNAKKDNTIKLKLFWMHCETRFKSKRKRSDCNYGAEIKMLHLDNLLLKCF